MLGGGALGGTITVRRALCGHYYNEEGIQGALLLCVGTIIVLGALLMSAEMWRKLRSQPYNYLDTAVSVTWYLNCQMEGSHMSSDNPQDLAENLVRHNWYRSVCKRLKH